MHVLEDERRIDITIHDREGACMAAIAAERLDEVNSGSLSAWWVTRCRVVEDRRMRGVGSFMISRLKKELAHKPGFWKLRASIPSSMRRFYEANGFLSLVPKDQGGQQTLCVWHKSAISKKLCAKVWASDEGEPPDGSMSNLTSAPTTWFREEPMYAAELYVLERWGNTPQEGRTVYVKNGMGELLTFVASSVLEVSVRVRPL
jgi:hypothetical protein